MNENKLTVEEVRRCLGERLDRRGHRIVSDKAAALAVKFAAARIQEGISVTQVAEELGLKGFTLQRWMRESRRGVAEARGRPGFSKLEVRQTSEGVALVIQGPLGVRIEGLEIAAAAELLRKLWCSA